jgi:hypothetical protein
MGWYIEPLPRPYDYRALIEVYVRTRRKALLHDDFTNYYKGLLGVLEQVFGVRFSHDGPTFTQRVFWMRFESTVESLLAIRTPWENCIDDTLLNIKLEECGEPGRVVFAVSDTINKAVEDSARAHREMLYALFRAMFGTIDRIVTSAELAVAGFDDSKEPQCSDYYDDL